MYPGFIDYSAVFMKSKINSVFINPIKFCKVLAAGKNRIIYHSINSISIREMSAERNKWNFYVYRFLLQYNCTSVTFLFVYMMRNSFVKMYINIYTFAIF